MDNQSLLTYKSTFDSIMHTITADDGMVIEVWYARELQTVCGYSRWENFATAVKRAKEACKTQNISVDDHFRDVTKMVSFSGGYKESRTTCGTRRERTRYLAKIAEEIMVVAKIETTTQNAKPIFLKNKKI